MSTRSTTHFKYGHSQPPVAIIYRNSDGYPAVAGVDLRRFLEDCRQLKDSRFGDPSYLAAKYVVFLADLFNYTGSFASGEYERIRCESKLDFLSVGVVASNPGDIEYRYIVNCANIEDGLPHIKCIQVYGNREVDIPAIHVAA